MCHEVEQLYKDFPLLTTNNKETSTRHESTGTQTHGADGEAPTPMVPTNTPR